MLRTASASKALTRLLKRPATKSPLSSPLWPQTPISWKNSRFNSSFTRDTSELDTVTTLPNGIRVATEALPGHFSALGVYIDAGSRYENDQLRGASHIVDRLAFKSTSSRTSDEMLEAIESLGGNIQCASSRESLMYQAAVFNDQVPTMMGLLAETVRDPLITPDEVSQQLETAAYEIGEIWAKPEMILPELVHMVGYKDNTLGHPLLCPEERLGFIDRDVIMQYRELFYRPERIVLAFAGVSHDKAVKLAEQYFGDMKSPTTASTSPSTHAPQPSRTTNLPPQSPSLLNKIPFIKNLSTTAASAASVLSSSFDSSYDYLTAPSHYTGGVMSVPAPSHPLPSNQPAFTHFHIAFEALPISHPDIYAQATLQTLLGGGGSFSAGGPGKGMYSRLFTHVLNNYGWVESCIAFNNSYTDSGLFGIAASCIPGAGTSLIDVILRELKAIYSGSNLGGISTRGSVLKSGRVTSGNLTTEEVDRAKNQLRSSLLMNLESRMVELEDLGRQVQVHGRKIGPKEMCEKIEEVTPEDVRRVAERLFTGQIRNVGEGTGKATVVLQAAADEKERRGMEGCEESIRKLGMARVG